MDKKLEKDVGEYKFSITSFHLSDFNIDLIFN